MIKLIENDWAEMFCDGVRDREKKVMDSINKNQYTYIYFFSIIVKIKKKVGLNWASFSFRFIIPKGVWNVGTHTYTAYENIYIWKKL